MSVLNYEAGRALDELLSRYFIKVDVIDSQAYPVFTDTRVQGGTWDKPYKMCSSAKEAYAIAVAVLQQRMRDDTP